MVKCIEELTEDMQLFSNLYKHHLNPLHAIEEILDTLEDEHDVNPEKFREVLGKVWTEYNNLNEKYII